MQMVFFIHQGGFGRYHELWRAFQVCGEVVA